MARSPTAAPTSSLPAYIEPCLPRQVAKAPSGPRWVHEIKHDGYRLAVRIDAGEVRLVTRRGLDWTKRFPLVVNAAGELDVRSAYLDGEVVIEGDDGIADWVALHACASAGRCPGAILWAFDLLFLNGKDLRSLPLIERKARLFVLLGDQSHVGIRYVEHIEGEGQVIFEHASGLGIEGIVSKLADSPYRSGRSDAWQKTKSWQRDRFVVAGYIPNTGDPRLVGALVLGQWKSGELVPAGKVGTGWSVKLAGELAAALDTIRQPDPPFATRIAHNTHKGAKWVRPIVTVEVDHRGWTGDGLLRHPSFRGVAGTT
ncbi:MAG: hypothetical protein EOS07_31850 [Mesorhizobium sp.]|nr:MAG: hypothetical protein EOS07_31850 [Mesorhizobium sp.]